MLQPHSAFLNEHAQSLQWVSRLAPGSLRSYLTSLMKGSRTTGRTATRALVAAEHRRASAVAVLRRDRAARDRYASSRRSYGTTSPVSTYFLSRRRYIAQQNADVR
mgnify:CR=1 FL=1